MQYFTDNIAPVASPFLIDEWNVLSTEKHGDFVTANGDGSEIRINIRKYVKHLCATFPNFGDTEHSSLALLTLPCIDPTSLLSVSGFLMVDYVLYEAISLQVADESLILRDGRATQCVRVETNVERYSTYGRARPLTADELERAKSLLGEQELAALLETLEGDNDDGCNFSDFETMTLAAKTWHNVVRPELGAFCIFPKDAKTRKDKSFHAAVYDVCGIHWKDVNTMYAYYLLEFFNLNLDDSLVNPSDSLGLATAFSRATELVDRIFQKSDFFDFFNFMSAEKLLRYFNLAP